MNGRKSPSLRTKRHYDWFSAIYDPLARLYCGHAQRAAAASLRLNPGNVVLDVACGTGINFEYILPAVTNSGLVIGLEYSAGMIERANHRVRRHAWRDSIRLCQCDARELSSEHLAPLIPEGRRIDRLLFSLVLSVLPDWERIFRNAWELLRPGGRCTILDQHFPTRGAIARITEAITSADLSRKVWEPLKDVAKDYEQENVALLRHYPSRMVIASGVKSE